MAKDKDAGKNLKQYHVRYLFGNVSFYVLVMAESSADAGERALIMFRKDGYPMAQVKITSAVLHELVEGPRKVPEPPAPAQEAA